MSPLDSRSEKEKKEKPLSFIWILAGILLFTILVWGTIIYASFRVGFDQGRTVGYTDAWENRYEQKGEPK